MNIDGSDYNLEVKERYGETDAYKEYLGKTANYNEDKWNHVNDGLIEIFQKFEDCKKVGLSADSEEAQLLVKGLQSYITDNYYTCTNEILLGLGKMYADDERFRANIDKKIKGTAELVSKAIKIFCK